MVLSAYILIDDVIGYTSTFNVAILKELTKHYLELMDIALVVSAVAVSITYLIEIDSVCLIDLMSGERARIMAETKGRN